VRTRLWRKAGAEASEVTEGGVEGKAIKVHASPGGGVPGASRRGATRSPHTHTTRPAAAVGPLLPFVSISIFIFIVLP